MKKLFIAAIAALSLSSCSLFNAFGNMEEIMEGTDDEYVGYDGMNVSTEPLSGKAYVLPTGIEMAIAGAENDQDQTLSDVLDNQYGSGDFVVNHITLTNTTDSKITVEFPAGLMFQSASSDYQNGLLVKAFEIDVKAGAKVEFDIHMYCLNSGAHASSTDASYSVAGICNYGAFDALFNVCEGKKVNIDQYRSLGIIKYYSSSLTIQQIVWAITKGKHFSEDEIEEYLKKTKND